MLQGRAAEDTGHQSQGIGTGTTACSTVPEGICVIQILQTEFQKMLSFLKRKKKKKKKEKKDTKSPQRPVFSTKMKVDI